MGRKKLPTPPNTDIPFKEYEKLATDLYFNKGKTPAQIKAQLGNPHWDGKDWFIEFRKSSPDKLIRTEAHKKVGQLTKRGQRSQFVNEQVLKWAENLDKQGKWPEGKSLEGFIAAEKRLETLLKKEIERLKKLGLDVSDGHIIALANENVRGTPLDAKGQGGSHSPRSRVPELQFQNKSRGAKYDIDKLAAREAGIVTKPQEAFLQYLTGDTGTGVHLTTKDKQRIHSGENPDKVLAQRDKYVEGKKMEAANKKAVEEYKLIKNTKNKTGDVLKLNKNLKLGKKALKLLPLGALSGYFSGLEAKEREAKAAQTGNTLDKLQAGISRFEQATDYAGAVPGPQSLITEPAGLAAAGANLFLDAARFKRDGPMLGSRSRFKNNK